MEQLISAKDAAKMLGCTVPAVRRWLQQGRIEPVKLGSLTRIRKSDLEAIQKNGLPQEDSVSWKGGCPTPSHKDFV